MQTRRFQVPQHPPQVVTGFLRMQVHVREVRIRRAVHRPALLVMAAQTVLCGQVFKQLTPQSEPFITCAHRKLRQRPLHPMDFPATCIGVKEKMQQTVWREQIPQGLEPCRGIVEMVQHPNGIDVIKRSLALEIQQAPLLLTQRRHNRRCAGTSKSLTRHIKCPWADVHGKHVSPWIEMAEVIGGHTGATASIKNFWSRSTDGPGPGDPKHRLMNTSEVPSPVVPGRGTILKRVAWVREAVVKGADHRGCSIR